MFDPVPAIWAKNETFLAPGLLKSLTISPLLAYISFYIGLRISALHHCLNII